MGGTFNPVHMVHLILAENAYSDFSLDEVILLPNGDPPHKTQEHIAPAADRFEMLKIAAGNVPYFSVSDIETRRDGYSYSADTLLELKRAHPDTDYYFIMGKDSLFQIERWHEPAVVMANCIILASVRDNVSIPDLRKQAEYLREKYDADIRILDLPDLEISSSEIRERCARGQSVRFMVPEGVDSYIREHKLYSRIFPDDKEGALNA